MPLRKQGGSDEEQVFSPEVAVVVPRAVREARPPPDDLAVVEEGERV